MRQIPGYALWLGHAGDLRGPKAFMSAGIRAVVDLAAAEVPAILSRELTCARFPLLDGEGNPSWLIRAAIDMVAGLLKARVPTLVACSVGMSRSVCVTAAAFSIATACPPEDALRTVATSGPADVSPALWSSVVYAIDEAKRPKPE
jgi:hypothetical protein